MCPRHRPPARHREETRPDPCSTRSPICHSFKTLPDNLAASFIPSPLAAFPPLTDQSYQEAIIQKENIIIGEGGVVGNQLTFTTPPPQAQDLNVIEEVIRMMLEIINSCLCNSLHHNPNLVYALLYKRELFEQFRTHPSFQDIMQNLDTVRPTFGHGRVLKKKKSFLPPFLFALHHLLLGEEEDGEVCKRPDSGVNAVRRPEGFCGLQPY